MPFSRTFTVLRRAYQSIRRTDVVSFRSVRCNPTIKRSGSYVKNALVDPEKREIEGETTPGVRDPQDSAEKKDADILAEENRVTIVDRSLYDSLEPDLCVEDELPGPLDKCTEDLSHIGPYNERFSFASVANTSETIRRLVDLGVNLYKLQNDPAIVKMILLLDYKRDVEPRLSFLRDHNVPPEMMGQFITKCPHFLQEDLANLDVRVRYLLSHGFTSSDVATILSATPAWLLFKINYIDGILCFIQNTYKLSGNRMKEVITKMPAIALQDRMDLERVHFALTKELGLELEDLRYLITNEPRIWLHNPKMCVAVYNYAHLQMDLSKESILQNAKLLLCRPRLVRRRHEFLKLMHRAHYDPTKPLYVAPADIIMGSDEEFCTKIAKTTVEMYDTFVKMI